MKHNYYESRREDFEKCIDYLEKMPRVGDILSLDRIKNLLNKLNNPEKKLKGIHVAGTNGKGSVCAMLQSILTDSGYKVGLFTSPHLIFYTERYRIGYKDISEPEFLKYIKKIKKISEIIKNENNNPPTIFEILTAVGILYFADQKVDLAIFETGLGGRGDATNVLDLGNEIITNVSLEHTDMLGNTLMKILKEKAEIIKENSSVVTGCQEKKLQKYIEIKCEERQADLQILGRDIKSKVNKINWNGIYCDISARNLKLKNLCLPLLGEHQIENATCVVGAVKALRGKGYKISNKNIRKGLKNVLWKARFQVISNNPKIILDSAHNPAGIKTLAYTLKSLTNRKAIILFNVKKTKDVKKMLNNLNNIASKIIFVDMPEVDVIYRAESLKNKFKNKKYSTSKKFDIALNKAKKRAIEENRPIVVCGSIYFLGNILKKKI